MFELVCPARQLDSGLRMSSMRNDVNPPTGLRRSSPVSPLVRPPSAGSQEVCLVGAPMGIFPVVSRAISPRMPLVVNRVIAQVTVRVSAVGIWRKKRRFN